MRRMDRYKDESTEPKLTRSDQNKDLYESIGNNTRYTSFSDVTNANAIDITIATIAKKFSPAILGFI